ncbi:MAG: homoserine O-acetyltransferase [Candidatus Nanopelagicales bacterium]|nr:homoserine O-acetyltransferase [Candidatus Nanopelagicales bacterium]
MPTNADRLPAATAAWQPGDDPAWRQFASLGSLDLDLGGYLPQVDVAYETWGELSPARDNAVLVLHALTADSHVVGTDGPGQPTEGWWQDIVGPGRPLDTDNWFVIASNVLGGCQGTTGPASLAPDGRSWGSRWPRITVRDQVAVEVALANHLEIDRFALIVGGSMGGLRALEWAITEPDRVGAAVVLACGAAATADQIAVQTVQIQAITADPQWAGGDYHDAGVGGGPHAGMGVARRFAHITYRCEPEFSQRFGNKPQPGENPYTGTAAGVIAGAGRFSVQSYLDHQANKLARRFDAGTYVTLTDTMSTHDVGRGRGGVDAALASIRSPVVVGGITSDRLYPLHLQQELADKIPTASALHAIESPHGHDGFLLESEAIGTTIKEALALTAPVPTAQD